MKKKKFIGRFYFPIILLVPILFLKKIAYGIIMFGASIDCAITDSATKDSNLLGHPCPMVTMLALPIAGITCLLIICFVIVGFIYHVKANKAYKQACKLSNNYSMNAPQQ